tara:strand:+ start:2376 stop:2900 length:525 start_codon:yes stop_codon:yes gene_type:complete
MADYTMEDEKWTSRVALIESHMTHNDVGDMAPVLKWNLTKGTTDKENRKRYWSNITNLFATVENSPIQIGKRSTLPQVVQDSLNLICAEYANGHAVLFVSHPLYGETLRARGKAGYTPYESGESYGEAMAKNLRSRLTAYYNNHTSKADGEIQWDGSISKKGVPTGITYPEVEG